MESNYQAVIAMPFGHLGIRVEQEGLAGIDFLSEREQAKAPETGLADAVCAALKAYLVNPHKRFDLPLVLKGTPFQQRIWHAIAAIPAGETLSYTQLAAQVQSGPRAVANACGANPVPIIIPCHRVVAKQGLGGFMQGWETTSLTIKQWLLAHERGEPHAFG